MRRDFAGGDAGRPRTRQDWTSARHADTGVPSPIRGRGGGGLGAGGHLAVGAAKRGGPCRNAAHPSASRCRAQPIGDPAALRNLLVAADLSSAGARGVRRAAMRRIIALVLGRCRFRPRVRNRAPQPDARARPWTGAGTDQDPTGAPRGLGPHPFGGPLAAAGASGGAAALRPWASTPAGPFVRQRYRLAAADQQGSIGGSRRRSSGSPPTMRLRYLQHTYASLLLARGHALPVASEGLGHRPKSTTANLCAHALPTAQRAAAQVLEAFLPGPGDDPGDDTGTGRQPSHRVRDRPVGWKGDFGCWWQVGWCTSSNSQERASTSWRRR